MLLWTALRGYFHDAGHLTRQTNREWLIRAVLLVSATVLAMPGNDRIGMDILEPLIGGTVPVTTDAAAAWLFRRMVPAC